MSIPVSELHGVGPALKKRLGSIGIETLEDLVWHLPRLHEDRSVLTAVVDIEDGMEVNVRATVEKINARKAYRRQRMQIVEALVGDSTGSIKVVWFNQPHIAESLRVGDEVLLSGKAKKSKYGLALQSPVHEKITPGRRPMHTGRIVPKYGLTAGVTQKQMRYFVKQALEKVLPLTDYLPAPVRSSASVISLGQALRQAHFPDSLEEHAEALQRLDFDRLYMRQLFSQLQRQELSQQSAPVLPFAETVTKQFVEALPFKLTDAQRKAAWEIFQDMERERPMNRLLVGDVGSGKTVVAALALLQTVTAGAQGVLMAPTEILAKQHYEYISSFFKDTNYTVALQTGSTKSIGSRQGQLLEPDIVIGTHALIQKTLQFRNLGLAVIDEQHRFGVEQRRQLKERSGDPDTMPHLLSMTATPIPRTLGLALYGDLDLSVIDEMPVGRKPVKTSIVPPRKRAAAYEFIIKHLEDGKQCFILCPLIDPSDRLGVKSVTAEFDSLKKGPLKDRSVAMLHGKMQPKEKDAVMEQMRAKQIEVLVATSVIEVGVDIPDATIMMIEGAERFGLAQLHQFRGRVGRSEAQSYCLLFTDSSGEKTTERLQALVESNDGLKLAEKDLLMRGAGEVFGKDQSGFSEAAVLAIQQPELLQASQQAAQLTIADGWLQKSTPLQEKMNEFIKTIHLE